MNILIRTGGGRAKNKELGLGHIFRTINLASHFKTKKINFLLEDYGGAKEEIINHGFKNIFLLKKEPPLENDLKQTMEIIFQEKIDLIIIDRYKISKSYVKKLKKFIKVVVISDLKNIDYDCNLLVNGFVGYENKIIHNKYRTKCLLGPTYQILNKEFNQKKKNKNKQNKLLITFGGYDENNITEIVLDCLLKYKKRIKTKIILGPSTSKLKLNKLLKKYNNIFEIVHKTKNMAKEISNTEFGLCSGGMTTYEFASFGIPFGIICQVKHQLITAKEWDQKGLARNLGLYNQNIHKKIEKFLRDIDQNEFLNNSSIQLNMNKFGAKRVSKEILDL
jgi:UDP-2,4-diacetamido-2,4,6-trideoxy-beta-L-altropyranose hydrolase